MVSPQRGGQSGSFERNLENDLAQRLQEQHPERNDEGDQGPPHRLTLCQTPHITAIITHTKCCRAIVCRREDSSQPGAVPPRETDSQTLQTASIRPSTLQTKAMGSHMTQPLVCKTVSVPSQHRAPREAHRTFWTSTRHPNRGRLPSAAMYPHHTRFSHGEVTPRPRSIHQLCTRCS